MSDQTDKAMEKSVVYEWYIRKILIERPSERRMIELLKEAIRKCESKPC